MDTVSREEFEKLKTKYTKLKDKYKEVKGFVKILAEKEGLWCNLCKKVLEKDELQECFKNGCYNKMCDKMHISFYDTYEGEIGFCSEKCLEKYKENCVIGYETKHYKY